MGFRLNVCREEDQGDSRARIESGKLYGYFKKDNLEGVKYLEDLFGPDEFDYRLMCYCPYYGPYVLTEEQFSTFIGLYFEDFMRCYPEEKKEFLNCKFYKETSKLAKEPGNKIINWF